MKYVDICVQQMTALLTKNACGPHCTQHTVARLFLQILHCAPDGITPEVTAAQHNWFLIIFQALAHFFFFLVKRDGFGFSSIVSSKSLSVDSQLSELS